MTYLLIFDDNPQEWQKLSKALDGYKIIRIDHTKPLDKCIRLFHPELVLLNLYLKGADTWDIFQDIRIAYPNLPILTYVAKDNADLDTVKEAIADVLCSTSSLAQSKGELQSSQFVSA